MIMLKQNKYLINIKYYKYCELPHDDRKNWCRLTIQPKLSEQQFIKELL